MIRADIYDLGERFVSPEERTPSYDMVISLLREVKEAERAAAEGLTLNRWKEWKNSGLSRSSSIPCLSKLVGNRCPGNMYHECVPRGFDHTTMWTLNGKPYAVVTQPYTISMGDLELITDSVRALGLRFFITARDSWHFPGHTLALIVYRNEFIMPVK